MRRAALVLLVLSACGPKYGRRVPDSLLEKLPYESRIELLEAENDLALAIDRVDESENEIHRTRESLRRAKDRLKAAENEVGEANDAVSKEVAILAVAEGEARVAFLRARQEVNVESLQISKLSLRCAHARFELARLNVARKAKVEGAESLSVPDFESQIKSCEDEVADRKTAMKDQTQAVAAAKEAWDKEKQALAKKTFDARASPYVE
jgi:hypothetical protein